LSLYELSNAFQRSRASSFLTRRRLVVAIGPKLVGHYLASQVQPLMRYFEKRGH
jgi:hypothetical protein